VTLTPDGATVLVTFRAGATRQAAINELDLPDAGGPDDEAPGAVERMLLVDVLVGAALAPKWRTKRR
jgi:hypothetical protein